MLDNEHSNDEVCEDCEEGSNEGEYIDLELTDSQAIYFSYKTSYSIIYQEYLNHLQAFDLA